MSERLARERCELAFAAYINAQKSVDLACPLIVPVDVPIFIRKGRLDPSTGLYVLGDAEVEELPVPSINIAVPKVKPHEALAYPICELHVILASGVDEENSAARISARFGWMCELLDESHQATIFAALNQPPAPDNRKVKDFHVFGYYQVEEVGQEMGRKFLDHLIYDVHCVPTDDLSG